MKIVIAGAGLIGRRHIRHVMAHPRCDLVAVIDPMGAEVPDGVSVYTSAADWNGTADAAIIATPTGAHLPAVEALAGKVAAMLVEKPVGETAAEARAIRDAAGNTPVLAGYHRRHHPAVTALRDMLRDGVIGAPLGVSLIWGVKKPDDYFDGTWREGASGSPVMINLVHDLDLLTGLFGSITGVTGQLTPAKNRPRPRSGALAFRAGDTLASAFFSDNTPSPWGFEAGTAENPNIAASGRDHMRILGETGAISFPSLTVFGGSPHWGIQQTVKDNHWSKETAPLDVQLDHLCDVAGGVQPAVTLDDAIAVHEAAAAVSALMGGHHGSSERG